MSASATVVAPVWRKLMPSGWLPLERLKTEALKEAQYLTRRWDVPLDCGLVPDLADKSPRLFGTENGFRLAGRMLEEDAQLGFHSPASPVLFALLPVLSVLGVLGQTLLGGFGLALPLLSAVGVIAAISNVAGTWWAIAAGFFGVLLPVFGTQSVVELSHTVSRSVGASGGGDPLLLAMGWLLPTTCIAVVASVVVNSPRLRLFAKWCVGALILLTAATALPAGLAQIFWIALACCLAPAYARSCLNQRWLELEVQGNSCVMETTSGARLSQSIGARRQQARNVLKDDSTVIRMGTATGLFSRRFDGFSPDSGLPFCSSVNDLSTHFLCLGSTGQGKTTLIRRMVWTYLESKHGGVIVFDGKGALPGEFAGWPGFLLIQPGRCELALLEGLTPEDIAAAVDQVSNIQTAQTSSNGQYFRTQARSMLLQSAVFLEACIRSEALRAEAEKGYVPKWKWCVAHLVSMAAFIQQDTEKHRKNIEGSLELVRAALPDEVEPGSMLNLAIKYIEGEVKGLADEARSGIYSTLCGWLNPILQHRDFMNWAYCVTGVDPTVCLRGGAVGVNVPPFIYGEPGKIIQSLVKQRIFSALRARGVESNQEWKGRGETPVMIVADEAQEICGDADLDLLPVARSLGGQCVYATQNLESFEGKMGKAGALKFVDNFRSFACFMSSRATLHWAQERLGTTRSLVFGGAGVAVDFRYAWKMLHDSPLADPRHPGRAFYAKRRRWGAGQFADDRGRRGPISGPNGMMMAASKSFGITENLTLSGARGGEWKVQPLFQDADVDELAEKGVAVVEVMRGGVRRRDIVKISDFPAIPPVAGVLDIKANASDGVNKSESESQTEGGGS